MPVAYSNTYTMQVTPYTIDMTRGVVLNAKKEDTGLLLASKAADGVYSGFLGVTGWWNYYLQEGSGVTWGNDGVSGTPFAMSSEDSKWNFWYPGVEGCYYTVVDTRKARWSALHVSSLDVSGDITGQLAYNRKANRWTLAFDAAQAGTATIRVAGRRAATRSRSTCPTPTDGPARPRREGPNSPKRHSVSTSRALTTACRGSGLSTTSSLFSTKTN